MFVKGEHSGVAVEFWIWNLEPQRAAVLLVLCLDLTAPLNTRLCSDPTLRRQYECKASSFAREAESAAR